MKITLIQLSKNFFMTYCVCFVWQYCCASAFTAVAEYYGYFIKNKNKKDTGGI